MIVKKAYLLMEVIVAIAIFSVGASWLLSFEYKIVELKKRIETNNDALNISITALESIKNKAKQTTALSQNIKFNQKNNILMYQDEYVKNLRIAKINTKSRFVKPDVEFDLVGTC